jgi:hypothetical protein
MKKFFLVVVGLFFSLSVFSQQGFELGVKGGVNFATLQDASGFSNKTGFVLGGFIGGKIAEDWGVQLDVLYSQQGAEFDLGTFDTDYINIPVVLEFYLAKRIQIHAGPQFGFLVDNQTQTVAGNIISDIQTNTTDISGVVGVGLDLPLNLRVEGRYNFGFTDVPEDFDARNSVVTLSLGLSFF